jgi:DNA-directed RNA polymerase specialized sigma24 family protein
MRSPILRASHLPATRPSGANTWRRVHRVVGPPHRLGWCGHDPRRPGTHTVPLRQAREAESQQWEPLCRFIQARLADRLNGHLDSEDMVQEVLRRAYTGITHFRSEACIETWLKSIAQHVMINTFRIFGVRHSLHDGPAAHEAVRKALHSRNAPDPETAAVRNDLGRKLLTVDRSGQAVSLRRTETASSPTGPANTATSHSSDRHIPDANPDGRTTGEGIRLRACRCPPISYAERRMINTDEVLSGSRETKPPSVCSEDLFGHAVPSI